MGETKIDFFFRKSEERVQLEAKNAKKPDVKNFKKKCICSQVDLPVKKKLKEKNI